MIKLYGEQRRVLFLPPYGPILIKGVAGSGKTTVSLFRAQYLIKTYSNLFNTANVCIFTFNKTLVKYIAWLQKASSCEDLGISSNQIPVPQVTTFHSWVYNFLLDKNIKLEPINSKEKRDLISTIRSRYEHTNIGNKNTDFLVEEFSWIKGKCIKKKQEYLDMARSGRGVKLSKKDRETVWEMLLEYQKDLHSKHKVDYDDFALKMLKWFDENKNFNPPFTHIVVDEGQDLSKAQIIVLNKLISPTTNSITIVADTAQRIYKSWFRWKEVGLYLSKNRSITFDKNYRNTRQIAEAAISLLEKEEDKEGFTTPEVGTRVGPKPYVGIFENVHEEDECIINIIKNLQESFSSVILGHDWKILSRIYNNLKSKRIPCSVLSEENTNINNNTIVLCTLHSIKGLEFENVIISDINKDIFPCLINIDEDDISLQISTERRLLYTAMTRAHNRLFMLSFGNPSLFLSDISQDLTTNNLNEVLDGKIG